jgi:peptidyl-prolyl cis-trans isomerase A (cyclophilin A)
MHASTSSPLIRTLLLAAGLTMAALAAQAQTVKISTSEGDIRIQLDAEKAPKTVANFLQYVKSGHYNGLIFHRVIENFMIQGGGFTVDLKQKATKPAIALEANNGLLNLRGSLAMARTNDPNSATSQFFINTVDNAFLDAANSRDGQGYAVFGQVIEGMDVVDKIRLVAVGNKGPHQNIPLKPVIINKAIVESNK